MDLIPPSSSREKLIVAMTRNCVIGDSLGIPWHIPEELQLFRRLTLGGTIVMGRRTFASIGRPLEGRNNLVISRTLPPTAGISVCRTFDEAAAAGLLCPGDIWYAGGVEVYRRALTRAAEMSISWVREEYAGDVTFPECDWAAWCIVEETAYERFIHRRYLRRAL